MLFIKFVNQRISRHAIFEKVGRVVEWRMEIYDWHAYVRIWQADTGPSLASHTALPTRQYAKPANGRNNATAHVARD